MFTMNELQFFSSLSCIALNSKTLTFHVPNQQIVRPGRDSEDNENFLEILVIESSKNKMYIISLLLENVETVRVLVLAQHVGKPE